MTDRHNEDDNDRDLEVANAIAAWYFNAVMLEETGKPADAAMRAGFVLGWMAAALLTLKRTEWWSYYALRVNGATHRDLIEKATMLADVFAMSDERWEGYAGVTMHKGSDEAAAAALRAVLGAHPFVGEVMHESALEG